jgi:hypothetical protein
MSDLFEYKEAIEQLLDEIIRSFLTSLDHGMMFEMIVLLQLLNLNTKCLTSTFPS